MSDPTPDAGHELPVATCRDCGTKFRQRRSDQRFCSHKCNRAFWGRCGRRGGTLYPMLVAWRKSRGKDRENTLSDICRILDAQIEEDDKAGRVLICDIDRPEQLDKIWRRIDNSKKR